ncbi:MAG: MGH1-like glycoside hydrolase domain-containing protein [Promethearchaeota archaeon]
MAELFFVFKKRRLKFEHAEPPTVVVPDAVFSSGFDALNDLLYSNIMPPVGKHTDIWARPGPKFPAPYLWDSAFISQAWKLWDPTIALRILKPFVEFQDGAGRMPHQVFAGRYVSSLSNPPFLAWAVNNVLEYYPEKKWFDYFIDPLMRFVDWREKFRFNEEHGLYFWSDSYESGIDNSPRFRSVDEKEDYGVNHLGSIDVNSEIVFQHDAIRKMVAAFGNDMDVNPLIRRRDVLLSTMEGKLWDSSKQMFGDLDFTTGELKTIDTIASYFPLACKGVSAGKVAKLVEHLEDPGKYNTAMPLPSVSRDSPDFIKDMWRGPVWINTAYLVVWGLKMQGRGKLAGEFAYRLCKGVYSTWKNAGNFYEFYDPERYDLIELHRKKGNLFKAITLGTKPVKKFAGWTADVNTMLVENVIGLYKQDGKWCLEPHLPDEWLDLEAPIIVTLPFYNVHLSLSRGQGKGAIHASFKRGETTSIFSLENHEKIYLE